MDKTELMACLAEIGWSVRTLAARLGVSQTRAHRWSVGDVPVPASVSTWLRSLTLSHRRYRLPVGWEADAT